MIAFSIFLYVRHTLPDRPYWSYAVIATHLLANFCWTPIFFRMQSPGWALVDIIILDISLAAMAVIFWQAHKTSSILLWPYAAWVSFATYLNIGFYPPFRGSALQFPRIPFPAGRSGARRSAA